MSAEADIELVRGAYREWAEGGGLEGLLEHYADPEIVWHTAPTSPEPGPHRGHDGVRKAVGGYLESFEVFRPEPERILATGVPGQVLALVTTHVRGAGSGAEVSVEVAHLIQLREGKILSFEVIVDRAEALARAGLPPAT